jgi:hypothetical protein
MDTIDVENGPETIKDEDGREVYRICANSSKYSTRR